MKLATTLDALKAAYTAAIKLYRSTFDRSLAILVRHSLAIIRRQVIAIFECERTAELFLTGRYS